MTVTDLKRNYFKEWRANNRDKVNEYQRTWRKNNRDKVRQHEKRYWQKKMDEFGEVGVISDVG